MLRNSDRLINLALNGLLLLGGLLVALLIAEILLRLFWPQPGVLAEEGGFIYESGDLGFRLAPDLDAFQEGPDGPEFGFVFATNSDGLRDDEIDPKMPGTFRILILGDSYTFGYGAESDEAYPQVVEQLLNAQTSAVTFDVINAGIPAYTVRQQRAYLERYGLQFQPDLVIITVTRNDVDAAASNDPPFGVDANGYLITPDRTAISVRDVPFLKMNFPVPFNPAVFLQLNTHLYRFISRHVPVLVVDVVRQQNRSPDRGRRYPNVYAGVASISRDLAEVNRLAAIHTFTWAVVLVPDPSELPGKCMREEDDYEPQDTFLAWGDMNDVPTLVAIDAFCQHPDPASLLWPLDGHFKPEGYRLLAERVTAFLLEEGLLPEEPQ